MRPAASKRLRVERGTLGDTGHEPSLTESSLAFDRLVSRPVATLRPHPTYLELCGPLMAPRVRRVAQQSAAVWREPLLITPDGTILDGHARWQVAKDQGWRSLPCLERDLTEADALRVVIERHGISNGLNAFCRIVLALRLESSFRARTRRQPAAGHSRLSSKLTNAERTDVRQQIAREARVSTGNVTKVKQLLGTVIPEIRDGLLQGAVSIHKAWQWRTLSPKQQRAALRVHQHHGALTQTIRQLIGAHLESGLPGRPTDVANTVLGGLVTCSPTDLTVVIADVPGRAVVVTRALYDELRESRPNGPR